MHRRAGRALLPVEAEGAGDDAIESGVDIGVGFNDDRVLAAHLEDGALDEDLAGLRLCGALVNLEADGLRAGERDEAGVRMRNDSSPKVRALAGAQVDDTIRQAGTSSSSSINLAAIVGASTDGLRITVFPQTIEAAVIPAMIANGKFHGGITAPTPSGM